MKDKCFFSKSDVTLFVWFDLAQQTNLRIVEQSFDRFFVHHYLAFHNEDVVQLNQPLVIRDFLHFGKLLLFNNEYPIFKVAFHFWKKSQWL